MNCPRCDDLIAYIGARALQLEKAGNDADAETLRSALDEIHYDRTVQTGMPPHATFALCKRVEHTHTLSERLLRHHVRDAAQRAKEPEK